MCAFLSEIVIPSITCIAASIFAYLQIKQNKKSYNYEISQQYINNYNELMYVLDLCRSLWYPNSKEKDELTQIDILDLKVYYDKKFDTILNHISKVKNEARLMLSNEIIEVVNNVYEEIATMIHLRNQAIEKRLLSETLRESNRATNNVVDLRWVDKLAEDAYNDTLAYQQKFMAKLYHTNHESHMIDMITRKYQKYTKIIK